MQGKIEISDSGCWLWTMSVGSPGYGNAWDGTKVITAHRYAYTWVVGPIPGGLVLDHLCGVRRCVNPTHLEPVTQGENLRRAGLHEPGPIRTDCPIHGTEFMRVYRNRQRAVGVQGVCRECENVRQRARRARLIPVTPANG